MQSKRLISLGACLAAFAFAIAGCGNSDESGGGGGGGGDEVVIGASMPLTGALAPFGDLYKPGYQQAVDEVNAAGGLQVGDSKRKVKLVILDNKSDGTLAARQIRTLVENDGAQALLGAVGPELDIPQAATAEALRIPYVTTSMPILPWQAAGKDGRKYSWAFFFNPAEAIDFELKGAAMADTNKKIAFFANNDGDGKAWEQLLGAAGPKQGFEVVYKGSFPAGTKDFRGPVQQAQKAGAEIVMAIMQAPDGIALWKQMKGLGFSPKYAVCDKCGSNGGWPEALGPVAEGTSTVAFWSSSQPHPDLDHVKEVFGPKVTSDIDLGLVVAGYTNGLIVLDAIQAAGSTDPDAINDAIAKTDKDYPFAHIKFDDTHSSATPSLVEQWQNGTPVLVVPQEGDGKLQAPVAGLG
jgi:branched-chain amino acid transport system substrate-binding protein